LKKIPDALYSTTFRSHDHRTDVNTHRIRRHAAYACPHRAGRRVAHGRARPATSLSSHECGARFARLVHLSTRDIAGLT
jgi:hypothetical protein